MANNKVASRVISLRGCALGLVTAVAVVSLMGCANELVTSKIEKGIESKLPELIGPADSYSAEVHGSTAKMVRGRIREIIIHGRGVQVIPDMRLDVIEVRMTDVVADTGNSTLKSVGDLVFTATASQDSLNQYLARTRPDQIKVELLNGKMVVHAEQKVLRLAANVILTGRLVAKGQKLNFQLDKLEVLGMNAPSMATGFVEDRINPVLDLSGMGFKPELKSAVITPGIIQIIGTANLTAGSPAQKAADIRNK